MTIDSQQLGEVKSLVPGAAVMPDGNIDYIFLPNLKLLVAGVQQVLDGLLCPVQHGGYTTRLFLSQRFSQCGQNWTNHNILGREWHTWSWNQVPPNLPLVQILLAHARGLR